MITINRNSALHRFNKKWAWRGGWSADNDVKTLCQYFWMTVGSLLKLFLSTIAIVVFAGFILTALTMIGVGIFDDDTYLTNNPWWWWVIAPFVGAGVIGGIVGLAFLLAATFYIIKEWCKKAKSKVKQRPPTLLGQYVKAKKERVCPLVEIK